MFSVQTFRIINHIKLNQKQIKVNHFIIPPANEHGGGRYIGFSLSVCLSVRLSVPHLWTSFCPCMFEEMGAWIWENSQTNFSRNVNLEFLYWIDEFSSIYSFLPVLGLGWFLKQEILSEKLWRTLGGGGVKIHNTRYIFIKVQWYSAHVCIFMNLYLS